jgi:hypothetical protein
MDVCLFGHPNEVVTSRSIVNIWIMTGRNGYLSLWTPKRGRDISFHRQHLDYDRTEWILISIYDFVRS